MTIRPGLPGAPANAVELAEQPTCRDLAEVEVRKSAIAGAAFFGLALAGIVVGLVDDRVAYWRAPRFESLLRPMDRADRIEFGLVPNVDVDELGSVLPPIERPEVVGLVVLGPGRVDRPRRGRPRRRHPGGGRGARAVARARGARSCAALAYVAATAQRWAVFGDRSRPPEIVELTVATSWSGTLRPLVGAFGIDTHHLRKRGASLDEAIERVQSIESISALAHLVLLGVSTYLAARDRAAVRHGRRRRVGARLPAGPDPARRACPACRGGGGPRRSSRGGRRPAASAPSGVDRSSSAILVASTLALTAARVGVLAVAIGAAGGDVDLTLVLWLYLVAVVLGELAPTPNGVGVVEIALVLGLYFTGLATPVAVVGVLTFRVLTAWLPLLPGWRASRSLHRSGGL